MASHNHGNHKTALLNIETKQTHAKKLSLKYRTGTTGQEHNYCMRDLCAGDGGGGGCFYKLKTWLIILY